MGKLGVVLYEYLEKNIPRCSDPSSEPFDQSSLSSESTRCNHRSRTSLPRLTPILRNRHEKVQENTIDLVGRIAERGPETVNAREWMRICFELLDMLKAHKKGIRRASNNCFGFIARALARVKFLRYCSIT